MNPERQALHEHRERMSEIGAWSTMNANLQSHLLAARAAGLDPQKSVIPWGSSHTVNHINQTSGAGAAAAKLALTAVAALGVGGGALGLAGLAGLLERQPPAAPAPAPQYEWILDVERTHEFRGQLDESDRAASRRGSVPATARSAAAD